MIPHLFHNRIAWCHGIRVGNDGVTLPPFNGGYFDELYHPRHDLYLDEVVI